jgi:hypothetical protein
VRDGARAAALVATFVAGVWIASTYTALSATFDEPAHIAVGVEWLSTSDYRLEQQHPPLGRIAAGVGPWIDGARRGDGTDMWREGNRILGVREHFVRTLALARLGELPFFLLLCGVVWALARRVTSQWGAAIGVTLTATNPNVLAHAGLATTDIGLTATLALAVLAWLAWCDRPSLSRTIGLALAVAAAVLTRFSAIAFLGLALPLIYAARSIGAGTWKLDRQWPGRWGLTAALGLLTLGGSVWAVYGFDVGPALGLTLPAPGFFTGVRDFLSHGGGGHPAFLFGQVSMRGWWYYFPVALVLKTPIPLIALSIVGAVALARSARGGNPAAGAMLIAPAAVLAVGMLAHVNIGVRHMLPIYPFMAAAAAAGAVALWETSRTGRIASIAAMISAVIIPARAHPDHLAYFNALAGPRPEVILSDSNLDWGQDLYRLRDVVIRHRIDTLRIAYFGSVAPAAAGVPNTIHLAPGERPTGWVAASETLLAGVWTDTAFKWLADRPPVGRVGRSIRLYHIRP